MAQKCRFSQEVCISEEVNTLYTGDAGASPWSDVMYGSKCVLSNEMSLGTRLWETQFAWSFFAWSHLWQVVTTLIFLFLAKYFFALPYWVHAKTTGDNAVNISEALVDPKKHAVCLSFAGYIFGYATVIESQFQNLRLGDIGKIFEEGADTHRLDQFMNDLGWVFVGLAMMFVSELFTHNLVLRGMSNSRELMVEDNRALGLIEGGSYVASGFIISACITLDDGWLSLLFYFAGEIALMAFSNVYQMSTKYDDEASVKSKNVASGLHWGLSLAALGLLLSRALRLSQSIVVFLVWFGVGAPMLLLVTKIVNQLIFPALNIEDELYTAPLPPDQMAQNPMAVQQNLAPVGGGLQQMDPLAHRMRGGEAPSEAAWPAVSPRPPNASTLAQAAAALGPAPSSSAPPAIETVVREAFTKYDKDETGTLTKDECVDLIGGLNLSVTRQYLEGVWSVYDTNGDGTLDIDEFAIFYHVLQKRSAANQAKQPGGEQQQQQQQQVGGPGSARDASVMSSRAGATFEMEDQMSSSARGGGGGGSLAARPAGSVNYANYTQHDELAEQGFAPSDAAAAEQGLSRTSTRTSGGKKRVHNWGVALVVGALSISMAQLLNTFLRDCSFEFGVH